MFAVLSVIWIIHYIFFEVKTIGGDSRYLIYIFLLPTIIGALIIALYEKKMLVKEFKSEDDLLAKVINMFFTYLGLMLFSYLSFGTLANATWNQLNVTEGNKNKIEYIECEISQFQNASSNSDDKIWFYFKGNKESVSVDYQLIKPYLDKNTNDYSIVLKVREGMWENYIIENWNIEDK